MSCIVEVAESCQWIKKVLFILPKQQGWHQRMLMIMYYIVYRVVYLIDTKKCLVKDTHFCVKINTNCNIEY